MTKITIKDNLIVPDKSVEDIPKKSWFLGGMDGKNLYLKTKNGLIVGLDTLNEYPDCDEVQNYKFVDSLEITVLATS